ncbi:MAG: glycine cleavage system aminomethyltransferase GcvT [Steroidobacteraceae bacterium]
MGRETPLYELHEACGASFVDFGGWNMPLHYGSQIAEHHAVRRSAGVFDVSHMGIIDVRGNGARGFLERLLANDVGKLTAAGQALYSLMLDESGGIVDDLIAYFLVPGADFRLIVNAATRDGDLAWMRDAAAALDGSVEIQEHTDLALLALQGPDASAKLAELLAPADAELALALRPFQERSLGSWLVARTGYTGEDGFEVMMPAADAAAAWSRLIGLGVQPCGLGARDTLRLEAGLNLYGHDMDRSTHPFESGLGWTVALEPRARRFTGRDALEAIAREGSARKLVGLVLESGGVLRAGQRVVVPDAGEGFVTSGTFSPTLGRSIALARVPAGTGARVSVNIRGKALDALVVKPPFVRHGRSCLA